MWRWLRVILLTVLVFALLAWYAVFVRADEGAYAAIGITASTNPSALQGRNPLSYLRVGYAYRVAARWSLDGFYQHESSIPDGPPINQHRDERWHDLIGVALVYRFGGSHD